ncbi:DUF2599 domain-containing protein [Cellulomonas pakistanensis]|uniref:DUF2599 domain-containing protein n=1 Tax=Cellulomonas pakistanensis TaxID=992287 RepID=A0A919U7I6_9CELL|nr:DUF2599 domain-containing protein [Cellulomonas pakistanensis]GIG37032.1 hypothetical protein Cpa01nite_24130 [Cellulomonas pakistanensis]
MTRRSPRTLAAAVALGALLAGCTAGGDSGPAPAPATDAATDEATAGPEPAAASAVRADGTPVASGGVTLSVLAPAGPAASAPAEDDAVLLTVAVPAEDSGPALVTVATLAAPEGGSVEVLDDLSALVRDAGGAVLGGLTAPLLDDAAGRTVRVRTADDGTVTWLVEGAEGSGASGGSVTATFAATAVLSATWRDLADEGGRSLAVEPAAWARRGSLAAEEAVRAALVAAEPEADGQNVRDQLTCHLIGAPDKATWNLEPWRPDVGLLETIAALCNP